MLSKTHKAFAFTTLLTVTPLVVKYLEIPVEKLTIESQINYSLFLIVVTYFAATLPDYDRLINIGWLRHRGLTHTIWPIIALWCSVYYYVPTLNYQFVGLYALALVYTSHIVADAFSTAGIAWFYPIQGYTTHGSGAFYVNRRGPFLPLYHVGTKILFPAHIYWWLINIVIIIFLLRRLV